MQKNRHRETAFRIIVPIGSILVLLSTLEFFSWFYVEYFSVPTTAFDFRIRQPKPYRNTDYFSEDFVKESYLQPGGWRISEKTGDITPNDFDGRLYHTKNGERVTAFTPAKHENTVFVFGGSTIYSLETPDEYTVPSQLQLLFNKFYPGRYIVRNMGIISFTTTQQLRLLKTVNDIKKGDIVIFYDGVNEVFLNIFYANPHSSMVKVAKQNLDTLSWIFKFTVMLSERFYFARLFLNPVDYGIPKHLGDDTFINKMAELSKQEFAQNIIEAYKYSTEKGAVFFHFLQPQFYADDFYTEYEKELKKNKYLMPGGVEESFKKGYPHLKKVTVELGSSINSYDLSGIFDGHRDGDEYFLDSVHVNHTGNRVAAENIFRIIRNRDNSFISVRQEVLEKE